MIQPELLSVIVLTYKHKDLLLETLDSIFEQDYPQIELLVAEDGARNFSKEETEKYIRLHASDRIKQHQILVNSSNCGTVYNINHALLMANGQYIKLIAGDDTYPNAKVFSAQVAYLKEHPECALAVGNIVECDDKLDPIEEKGFAPNGAESLLQASTEIKLHYFVRKDCSILATQSICFTRTYFDRYGVFDERFKLIEDLPMGVRMITSECKIGYLDFPCVNHRGSVGISTSSNAFDLKRLAYYQDLKKYYEITLEPVKKTVGPMFVCMRRKMCCFRIEYVQSLDRPLKKVLLIAKYIPAISYYVLSNMKRTLFYLGKNDTTYGRKNATWTENC